MNIKKNITSFSIVFLLGLFLSGCNWFSKESEPKLIIVNVLDKSLYDDCHIKGSISIPFEEVEKKLKSFGKDDHIVVYCSNYMCTASGIIVNMLVRMGYKNVWAYEAGMAEWYQKGLPVEGKCKESYLKMEMAKPLHENKDIRIISTQELKDKIELMIKN